RPRSDGSLDSLRWGIGYFHFHSERHGTHQREPAALLIGHIHCKLVTPRDPDRRDRDGKFDIVAGRDLRIEVAGAAGLRSFAAGRDQTEMQVDAAVQVLLEMPRPHAAVVNAKTGARWPAERQPARHFDRFDFRPALAGPVMFHDPEIERLRTVRPT